MGRMTDEEQRIKALDALASATELLDFAARSCATMAKVRRTPRGMPLEGRPARIRVQIAAIYELQATVEAAVQRIRDTIGMDGLPRIDNDDTRGILEAAAGAEEAGRLDEARGHIAMLPWNHIESVSAHGVIFSEFKQATTYAATRTDSTGRKHWIVRDPEGFRVISDRPTGEYWNHDGEPFGTNDPNPPVMADHPGLAYFPGETEGKDDESTS